MRLQITSASSLRLLELDDVSQVVVLTDEGDPCSASVDTQAGAVITAHAGDKDFQSHLRNLGVKMSKPLEMVGRR